MKKRGIFFSADALIALVIISLVLLFAYPIIKNKTTQTEVHYDTLSALSTLKIGEINNSYVSSLILQGKITDQNKSVLEQIGEFYVSNITEAQKLADAVLQDVRTNQNIGIWYGNTLIASTNNTPYEQATTIDTTREIISGLKAGGSVTGFSARAFLTNSQQNSYSYFGGFFGQGNLSIPISYNGNATSAQMEIAINNKFDLYINGNYSGNFSASPSETTPVTYQIPIQKLNSGSNLIELRGSNLQITGGFIRITYITNVQYEQAKRYYFPGINGLINIYDGLSIPGDVQTLSLSIHLNSSYPAFLTIGNVTVFNQSTNGEQTLTFTNSQLSSLLNYQSLSKKTTPIRLGLLNISYTSNGTAKADVVSATDVSGSMADCGQYILPYQCRYSCVVGGQKSCVVSTPNACSGSVCGGTCFLPFGHTLDCSKTKITLAKEANTAFVDIVLNNSQNKLGLVGYNDTAPENIAHNLSRNSTSLKSKINQWQAGGGTCICCGINKAVAKINANTSADAYKSIVVLSDGDSNVQCAQQNTGNAKQDAINAACQAYNNYNITVYSIGFGVDADEATLQSIANCGHGEYYYSDVSQLTSIYQQIAQNIITASYFEQTLQTNGTFFTKLYPDSYIQFNYTEPINPYGLFITVEKQFDNSSMCTFSAPNGSDIVEARISSYSGTKWTDNVSLNNISVYRLKDYGSDYTKLGDPYAIILPKSSLQQTNNVKVTLGNSPTNSSSGSQYNKVIYTIVKNVTAFSQIASSAEGCNWHIEFEDGSNATIAIPGSYSGPNQCYYTSSQQSYNANDAMQAASFNLLREIDLNQNNRVDINFNQQDIQVSLTQVVGIPYTWSTEVQIRTWS